MAREQRLVFGEDADLYDKARPSYPSELIDDVIDSLGPPLRALDVGCGTAKATVLLARRGVTGIGLEADPAMAAVAARNLAPSVGWKVVTSDFEHFEPDPGSGPFDLVTCAQAWHWLDLDIRFRRAYALLRPGGRLALWWNRPGQDDSVLRQRVDAVYRDLFPTISPNGLLAGGRPPVGPIPDEVSFGDPIERVYPWRQRYSTSEWIDLVRTHSNHRLLRADQLAVLCQALAEVIDGDGGFYDHLYSCWLWTAQRR